MPLTWWVSGKAALYDLSSRNQHKGTSNYSPPRRQGKRGQAAHFAPIAHCDEYCHPLGLRPYRLSIFRFKESGIVLVSFALTERRGTRLVFGFFNA